MSIKLLNENHLSAMISSRIYVSKKSRMFWTGIGALATYKLFDIGLAHFLGLETLCHGTGPMGYIGINLRGGNPDFGGSGSSGMVPAYEIYTKGYFHVLTDTEGLNHTRTQSWCFRMIDYSLGNIFAARYFAVLAGINQLAKMSNLGLDPKKNELLKEVVVRMVGAVSGFCTPTLKFRFKPESILSDHSAGDVRFEPDPDMGNYFAYRTKNHVSAWFLGITGSLLEGIDADMLNRMRERPWKVLSGTLFIGTAALVGTNTYRFWKNCDQKKLQEVLTSSVRQNTMKKTKTFAKRVLWSSAVLATVLI